MGVDNDNYYNVFMGGDLMVKIDTKFLNELIEIRKKSGLNQSQIAKKIGYTRSNISAFEHGLSNSGRIMVEYLKLADDMDDCISRSDALKFFDEFEDTDCVKVKYAKDHLIQLPSVY